jgi:hypothetical protein
MVSSKNIGHEDNNPRKGLPDGIGVQTYEGGGNTGLKGAGRN